MSRNILLIIYILSTICFLSSCKKDFIPSIEDKVYKTNTLFILEANNNLRKEAIETINEIELGYTPDEENIVLVYVKTNSKQSILLKISNDKDLNTIKSDTIKIYQNTLTTAKTIGEISLHCQQLFPAKSYGLILWSHSTSWFPENGNLKTKSFGDDNGIDIDIQDLAHELPKNYNYIIFDSCNMASIEVLYEFKNNCNYILSSPSEVISLGFPYRNIMKDIINSNLNEVATKYFEYYYNFIGPMQSATVSLVETKSLEALAKIYSEIISNKTKEIFNSNGVQRMDFTPNFPVETYDFGSFIAINFNESERTKMTKQINNTVVFKRHTPYFNGQPIAYFSGITCYIPNGNTEINTYYKKLKWTIDSKTFHFL